MFNPLMAPTVGFTMLKIVTPVGVYDEGLVRVLNTQARTVAAVDSMGGVFEHS
jgi:hypothetical protein